METEIDYKIKYEASKKLCFRYLEELDKYSFKTQYLEQELEESKKIIIEQELKIKKILEMTTYLIMENYVQVVPKENNDNNIHDDNEEDDEEDDESSEEDDESSEDDEEDENKQE
jgi:hypothetical protein